MDTRTSQRTGGSHAGTTFYSGRRPSVDDMPRCTSHADVEHAFRSKDGVHYIVPDVIAASHDPGALGSDADDFNPYRPRTKGVKSTGIAFGGGVHTCIAMGMAISDLSGARYDSSERAGLMVACLREPYQRGMRPDAENVPQKCGVNMRRVRIILGGL